ncbi:MAG: hypothetical protein ACREKL_13295 [Chthoniobacterales bacterium]
MKISSLFLLAAPALVLFASCENGDGPRTRQSSATQTGSNNFGYQPPTPGTANDFVTDATPTPTPAPNATDMTGAATPPATGSTPPAPVAAADQRNLPVATPVKDMPGYVTSPYQPYAGYVDVRGYPPNTEVKDPYSGKIFLVP